MGGLTRGWIYLKGAKRSVLRLGRRFSRLKLASKTTWTPLGQLAGDALGTKPNHPTCGHL